METVQKRKFKISIPGAILIGVTLISLVLVLNGSSSDDLGRIGTSIIASVDNNTGSGGSFSNEPDLDTRVEVSIDDDPVLGDKDAPVTLIEFSDYQCPFCRTFWTDSFPQLKKEYIDTGKVKFVYRDFPLGFHPMAISYAMAASCAGEQDKYWEMHDMIFGEQAVFGTGTVSVFDDSDIKDWAIKLGLNQVKFNECFDSGKYKDEINNDIKDGSRAGVQGTPNFFINGRRIPGAVPYNIFQDIIEEELAR